MKECFLTEDELKKEREKIDSKMTTELLNNSDYEMVPVKYISKYGAEIIQYERKDGKYFYDKKRNPLKVVTGLSAIENVTESNIPENAAVTTYEYHPYLNTVTKMILPDGTTQYYEYNYWGLIEEQGYLDHQGEKYGVIRNEYNAIGELLSSTGEDGTGVTYTYNNFGEVNSSNKSFQFKPAMPSILLVEVL